MWNNEIPFAELVGNTITEFRGSKGDDEIVIICSDGSKYRQYHFQSCCESVSVEDICGDVADIIGSPILVAEESTSDANPIGVPIPEYQDSFTWTFYKLDTAKGGITIRWYGTSNGFYSEEVRFTKVQP